MAESSAMSLPVRRERTAARRLSAYAALFALILIARHPSMLWHAELWGEDGWVWYPDAYNNGLRSLLAPVAGYLQTVSRAVGLLSLALPIAWVPTCFMAAALAFQIAPAVFIVSSRMDEAWPSRTGRVVFALLLMTLPNSFEVFVNLTNVQWHLAVLAFLVLASSPPGSRGGFAFDMAALVISGLSGPFSVLLAPIALWHLYRRRSGMAALRAGIICAAAALQAAMVVGNIHDRINQPTGATLELLARIVSRQILLGPILGQHMLNSVMSAAGWIHGLFAMVVLLGGGLLCCLAFLRGTTLLREACVFAAALLAACLSHPVVVQEGAQWIPLVHPGIGGRYWFIPTLAWLGVLISLSVDRNRILRLSASVLLAGTLVGIWSDWRYPFMPPTKFAEAAAAFDKAPTGTSAAFPLNPPGARPMVLIKR